MHVSLLDHVVLRGFYEGGREPEKKEALGMISQKSVDEPDSFFGIVCNTMYIYMIFDR